MKKNILILFAAFLMAAGLLACGAENKDIASDNENLQIVATIFPEYDWVKNILGENPAGADVTLLLDSGVDLHSYQLTADDMMKISTCDMFIYVGGESDEWVEDALAEAVNKDMKVVNLMEALGDSVKEEEIVEGMQAEEEEAEAEEEEEGPEYDEHVWLSLRNASALTRKIADEIKAMDPENADIYEANVTAYNEKLQELDGRYEEAISNASVKTLLFGDRFPFRYLVDDYGLDYFAAFVGCSAENEASFETITFLAGKIDELGLNAVMTIEGPDHRIAEAIIRNTKTKDQQILTMDSLQSATTADAAAGTTYLSVMEQNLEVLKAACCPR